MLDKNVLIRYIYATAMKTASPEESAQAMQRVRVGMTGLAMVVALIGVASIIYASANRDQPVDAVGAPNAAVVANMTDPANSATEKAKVEPLATLGVAPSTTSTESSEQAKKGEAQRK